MTASAPASFTAFLRACLKIGCLSFGGPAGQIALMHQVFVKEKRWIDEARYMHALNYCMLLPGPEAQQLATYVGWLRYGVKGGVAAGALFVLPGAIIVLALSWIYAVYAQTPVIAAAFVGVKAAVLAIVAQALVKTGKRALTAPLAIAIAVAAFLALFLLQAPFPVVVIAAGVIGLLFLRSQTPPEILSEIPAPSAKKSLMTAALWAVLWLAPMLMALTVLGRGHVITEVGLFFSKLAFVSFGGAYSVLAYLQQQAVEAHSWVSTTQMIDGLGLAETTPGPLILVNQYVGFLAGWNQPGGGFGLALVCAMVASWQTFAPSFLWIFAGAPYAEALRRNARVAGALVAITAAVFGVIATLAATFGQLVLFRRHVSITTPIDTEFLVPDFSAADPIAVVIALSAAIALMRFNVGVAAVTIGCALLGVAFGAL